LKVIGLKSGAVTLLCLSLIALALAPCFVQAKQVSGTVSIGAGDFYGWRMDIMIPSTIEYNITCLNSTPISILVLDEANYTRFAANISFQFYEAHSFVNVTGAANNMTILSGAVYIVVDNSARSLGSFEGGQTGVEIEYWLGSSFAMEDTPAQGSLMYVYALVGVLAVGFVMVIYLTRRAVRMRKK
jgi:hypothetical protein